MDKSIITSDIKDCQAQGVLPQMPPDLFDDFITYLYERVDLLSFQRSKFDYKMRMYKQFIKSQPVSRLQYVLKFTHYEVTKRGTADDKKG